jgi:hypothetical protein
MAARKNGSKTMPGFVSGTAGGLLFTELGVGGFWAMLELLNGEAPATSKITAPVAKSLRRLFRR